MNRSSFHGMRTLHPHRLLRRIVSTHASLTMMPGSIDWLPSALRPVLDRYLEDVEAAAGERLFREGDETDAFYLIETGVVRLQSEREEIDTDPVFGFLGPGSTYGEVGFLDGQLRAASAYAEEAVHARRFSRHRLAEMEHESPALALAIYRHLGEQAAAKLRLANNRILGLPLPPAEEPGVADTVAAAWKAQEEFIGWSEERVDVLLDALAGTVALHAQALAEQTVAITHLGSIADKNHKNLIASLGVRRSLRTQPGFGLLSTDPTTGISELAAPVGVVFGLIPLTSPVATAIFKTLICLKSRNALILSFHRSTRELADTMGSLLRETLAKHGAPPDLVQWVKGRNSRRTTAAYFHHPGVSLLLATGGTSMVMAAYSSGKPALGVGPGNAPALICRDCDLDWAARCIVDSKSFDHGIICGSEHNLVVPSTLRADFTRALETHGAAVLDPSETTAFVEKCLVGGTALRRQVVGHSAQQSANAAGIRRDYPIRLLVVPTEELSAANPLALEKMAPVVGMFEVRDEPHGLEVSRQLLELAGRGHTAVIHSHDEALIKRFAALMPASRILVNTPASQGVVGYTTGLVPSFTLGCGTYGGTSTTDNVTFTHLRNVKRIAPFRTPPKEL